MNRSLSLTVLLASLTPLALQGEPQAPTPAPGAEPARSDLPPGVAALVDGVPITIEEYKDYLFAISGKRPLHELIREQLLFREASRLGIVVTPEEMRAEVDAWWQEVVRLRHDGNAAAAELELEREGFELEPYLETRVRQALRDRLTEEICVGTRVVTEEMIVERFERDWGVGGEKVELRHLFLNRARVRAELSRDGRPANELSNEALDAEIQRRMTSIQAELAAGADFVELAKRHSHDTSVHQNDGIIPGYNYRRYGPQLADAVRAAEVGVPTGPIQTQPGWHLIVVESRVVTKLEDVREEVAALVAADDARFDERQALEQRLYEGVVIETF